MRRIASILLVIASTLPIGSAPAPFPKPTISAEAIDLEALRGEWVCTGVSDGTKEAKFDDHDTFSYVFTGKNWSLVSVLDKHLDCQGSLRIDPTNNPKAMFMGYPPEY